MKNIAMTRVDARLVHGQIAAVWTKRLALSDIVILSDETANDEFVCEILQFAAPTGVKLQILHIDEGVDMWKADTFPNGKTLLLFKDIDSAYEAYQKGVNFTGLNIGQAPKVKDRIQVIGTVSMNEAELRKLEELECTGVEVYFQPLPDEAKVPLKRASEKFNK